MCVCVCVCVCVCLRGWGGGFWVCQVPAPVRTCCRRAPLFPSPPPPPPTTLPPCLPASPPTHYRCRCKFVVGIAATTAAAGSTGGFDLRGVGNPAFTPTAATTAPLALHIHDRGAWVPVTHFPVATARINTLMPAVVRALEASPLLRAGVTGVSFLDTLAGDAPVVTLVYMGGEGLGPAWAAAAAAARSALGACVCACLAVAMRPCVAVWLCGCVAVWLCGCAHLWCIVVLCANAPCGCVSCLRFCGGAAGDVSIVGRCRGRVEVVGREHVMERLPLPDGRVLRYKQVLLRPGLRLVPPPVWCTQRNQPFTLTACLFAVDKGFWRGGGRAVRPTPSLSHLCATLPVSPRHCLPLSPPLHPLPSAGCVQVPGSFSNPNGHGNVATLTFLSHCARDVLASERARTGVASAALLELYSGNGNHSVALSTLFTSVVAVEIDAALCDAARELSVPRPH
jgi:hypothetical protein